MRKKVAIFTPGGIATGIQSQGFPLITQIVNRLANDFDITIYSLSSFNYHFKPDNYRACSPPQGLKPNALRWLYLVFIFIRHTTLGKYNTLYSFWGYPSGFIVVTLGKLFRIPSYVNILGGETANLPSINYGVLRKWRTRKLVLWTCKTADVLIAVSPFQKVTLEKYGVKRKIDVIPWGIDRTSFSPSFKKVGLPLKILHVANLTEVKDQVTLLKAFQLIRKKLPAKLRIVGADYLDGQLQALSKQMGLEGDVEFIGFVLYTEIAQHYHWADVFMLTSLTEGQNNAITEAMTCRILPVSTCAGIMDMELGRKVGIVTNSRDHVALADGVMDLYSRPDEWEQKRQAAYEWATQHDFEWTIQQLKEILNKRM